MILYKAMKYIQLLLFLFLLLPQTTEAETVLRVGNNISVEENQIVDGDYYVSAGLIGKTVMSGTVSGDMSAFGASTIINGDIGSDALIFSGISQLHASVTDDVRIVGGEVTIAGDVGGDVFVIANTLSILSTARVGGDVFFFGGDAVIEGDVEGSILGKAQSFDINAHVGKNVDVVAYSKIEFRDNTNIDGFVRYTSFTPLLRSQGAVISGEIQKSDFSKTTINEHSRKVVTSIFIVLFAILSLYLLAKREIEIVIKSIEESYFPDFLTGLAIVFLGPIIAIVLMVTVLGLFVGIIVATILVLLYILGFLLTSVVLGVFTLRFFYKNASVSLASIILGVIIAQLLTFVPVIGILILFVVYIATVGALARRIYQGIF